MRQYALQQRRAVGGARGVIQLINMKTSIISSAIGSLLLVSQDAFAYVDPGTGSLLIQWLFGIVMASLAVVNIYWHRFKAFFSGKAQKPVAAPDADTKADDMGSD